MTKQTDGTVRCAVIVGPQGVGKTTLLRALKTRAGGDAPVADQTPDARQFGMSTEPNFARGDYLGEPWSLIDCPGSVELAQAAFDCMAIADIVIVVADPSPDRAASLAPYFRFLDDRQIPHLVFINRIDETANRVRDTLEALQTVSDRPLVLRQTPIRDGDRIIGAVDLVSERAWRYREGAPSELIEIPSTDKSREAEAREAMLESLADFDDALMEQILEDRTPPSSEIYKLLAKELERDDVVPTLLGSAAHGNGVTRLWKLLRHETPGVDAAAARLGYSGRGKTVAAVFRTAHAQHVGKTSAARLFAGGMRDGDMIDGSRLNGMALLGADIRHKVDAAKPGDLVTLPRYDPIATGDLVVDGAVVSAGAGERHLLPAVFGVAIRPKNEKDDVKLSAALQKLAEEDASLTVERRPETGEFLLRGQGDMHLRLTAARLKSRYNIEIDATPPKASYRETIRRPADHHARHKKQSGGHGQFADIKVKIAPAPRGQGFKFEEIIHGGSVPRQFIPAVEAGVVEGLAAGPLGFPVVDLSVTLYDGQHHAVDSNEMSFKMAGRLAVREALPECEPVLLEPIHQTTVHAPSDHTNKVHAVLSARRGQILSFDSRAGWKGWDSVTAMLPEAGLKDLIIELRSVTQGAATFESKFDHYQEMHGRDAEKVVQERRKEIEAHH